MIKKDSLRATEMFLKKHFSQITIYTDSLSKIKNELWSPFFSKKYHALYLFGYFNLFVHNRNFIEVC